MPLIQPHEADLKLSMSSLPMVPIKERGARITPAPEGRNRRCFDGYLTGEEKLASPRSTSAQAQYT